MKSKFITYNIVALLLTSIALLGQIAGLFSGVLGLAVIFVSIITSFLFIGAKTHQGWLGIHFLFMGFVFNSQSALDATLFVIISLISITIGNKWLYDKETEIEYEYEEIEVEV